MADLLGLTAIFAVSLITLILAKLWPEISRILFVALILRILFLLAGHYIYPLPAGTSDAVNFEIKAWEIGQEGFFHLFDKFSIDPFTFFSWLHAIPYSLFGRSLLMGQSISLLFGIGVVFLGWKLSNSLWDKSTATKVGWITALFPSLILFSVLFLREIYICFFLLLALCGVVDWVKTDRFRSIIFAFIGFIGATLLHGAMFVGAIAFIIIIVLKNLKKFFKLLKNNRINLKNLSYLILFLFFFVLYLSNKIEIQYLGNFEKSTNIEFLLEKTNFAFAGDASWPEWTKAKTPIELFYKAPIRSIYFLFSPFPWDLTKIRHLLGFFDGIIYMYLSFLIIRNIKSIWRDPATRIILIILLFYIIVFGFGVGNFGTGIRHRTKFSFIFIILASSKIKELIFFKNKKI